MGAVRPTESTVRGGRQASVRFGAYRSIAMGRAPRVPTVLVLDDVPAIRLLLRQTLEARPLRVVEAGDVNIAWGLIAVERPALIIMEPRILGPDPLELCRALRRDPATASTRVLVLTTATAEADLRRARDAGADAIMTKPFRPIRLLAMVDCLLAPHPDVQRRASSGSS